MGRFARPYVLVVALLAFAAMGWAGFDVRNAEAQTKPLTYPQLITALGSRVPNQTFRTRQDVIDFLIRQVKQRRVDKPLTPSREDDLRQAGATDELIAAIRANSPPLPTPVPTPTPRPTPAATPRPLSTPAPKLTPTPTPINLRPLSELLRNAPKPGDVRRNSIGMELVWVPHGEFMMGSTEREVDEAVAECRKYETCSRAEFEHEMPKHKVTLTAGYWIGKFEVTQGQWQAVMGDNPSRYKECGPNCPVERVSWDDVQRFLNALNAKNDGFEYRLPTEAQWEYAARAGTTTVFAFGSSLSPAQANFHGDYPYAAAKGVNVGRTQPVGRYRPNPWGIYDMHGNVWEWCEDRYGSYPAGAVTNPTGAAAGDMRVVRGGSWISMGVSARSANRTRYAPSTEDRITGFRIVARPK